MNRRVAYICGVALLCLVGCKPQQDTKVESVPEVKKPLTQYYDQAVDTLPEFQTLAANFLCETGGLQVNGMVRMQRDSIIWISASKLVELGRLRLTPDSMLVYVKVLNQYVRTSYEEIRTEMGIDVDFATVQSVLTGKGSQKRQLQVEYDTFDSIGGQEFARKMDITLNDKRYYTTLEWRYTKITLNLPQSYPFYIPKTAHETSLQQLQGYFK